jgi:hypothetical protein
VWGIVALIKCKICGEIFLEWESAREHVKSKHREQVKYILSQLRLGKIKKLEKQGIDPENWAAGLFLAFMQNKESTSLSKVGK